MGNLCAVGSSMSKKDKEVVQILKVNDGKMLEFSEPIKVKDLLINYPNFYVGIFREATQCLPFDYMLQIGRLYYLVPCFSTTHDVSSSLCTVTQPKNRGVRIKVVVTKQQLRQLLSNRMRLESMTLVTDNKATSSIGLSLTTTFLRKLEPIVEESQ